MVRIISTLALLLSLSTSSVGQRSDSQVKTSVHLLRTSFETLFTYQDEPVAEATIACLASDWSVTMDWGDGTTPEALSHAVPAGRATPTPPGKYSLYGTHKYNHEGSYSASVGILVSCADKKSKITDHESFSVKVFDHVPVKRF